MATPETEVPDELEPLEEPEPAEPDPADTPEEPEARAELAHLGGYRSSEVAFRSAEGETGILEGRMLPYNVWARIDSFVEGQFYERFKPRSLAKTLGEKIGRLPILFEHGLSPTLGKMTIAQFEHFRDEEDGVHFRARLLGGLPELLMHGLRSNQYGASIRHDPVHQQVNRWPGKSGHNPEGWREHTVTESKVKEFSVVTFPAYQGTTAVARSLTDEIIYDRVLERPEGLLQHLRAQAEPSHSEPPTQEDPDVGKASRDTQPKPTRDWLSTERTAPPWHIP